MATRYELLNAITLIWNNIFRIRLMRFVQQKFRNIFTYIKCIQVSNYEIFHFTSFGSLFQTNLGNKLESLYFEYTT